MSLLLLFVGATASSVTVDTTPPPIVLDGAGTIARGPYGPAFPKKSVRELYRPAKIRDEVIEQPAKAEPTQTFQYDGPTLPVLMDFGGVSIGLKTPSLRDALHEQILADDEDAIIAILLAAT